MFGYNIHLCYGSIFLVNVDYSFCHFFTYNLCTFPMPILLSYSLFHALNFSGPAISTSLLWGREGSVVFHSSWFSQSYCYHRDRLLPTNMAHVCEHLHIPCPVSPNKSSSRMHTSDPESFVTNMNVALIFKVCLSSVSLFLLVLSDICYCVVFCHSPHLSSLSPTWRLCYRSYFSRLTPILKSGVCSFFICLVIFWW